MAKRPAAKTPEPAVMAAGAAADNAAEERGSPPADSADAIPEAKSGKAAEAGTNNSDEEGFRDEQGRFTGNPATLDEKVEAIIKVLRANGMSLPKECE